MFWSKRVHGALTYRKFSCMAWILDLAAELDPSCRFGGTSGPVSSR